MPETPPEKASSDTPETHPPASLLEQILQSKKDTSNIQKTPSTQERSSSDVVSNSIPVPQKPKEPISFTDFIKFVGALFFVVVIFFGSFLGYIVFHPEQASFLNTMFSIDRKDFAYWLKALINGSF
jgi:hypothetical protein